MVDHLSDNLKMSPVQLRALSHVGAIYGRLDCRPTPSNLEAVRISTRVPYIVYVQHLSPLYTKISTFPNRKDYRSSPEVACI